MDLQLKMNTNLALKKCLHKKLPDNVYVGKEEGSGLSRVDIAIGRTIPKRDVAIELKRNLTSSKLDRLKGQIDSYIRGGFSNIIIVLTGDTDKSIKQELKNYCDDQRAYINIIEK